MFELILSQLTNGFIWGWILALISIGLTLIYGQLEIVNVAHGVLYTLGAVVSYYCATSYGGWGISLLAAPLALALAGLLIYFSTIYFALGRSPIVTVIISYGLIFIIEQGVILTFGGNPRMIEAPIPHTIPFFGGNYPLYRILAAVFSGLVIWGLLVFLRRTRYGLWIRATNQDPETAENMGIPTRKVFAGVFCLGSALAGLGGALAAPMVSVSFDMGHNIIIDAFIVVIMAGFGSIRGTVAASLIISMLMGLAAAFVDPVMAKVITMAVLVVVLFIRPEGLFGEK